MSVVERQQSKQCGAKPTVRSKRMDKRVAQYLHLDSWLIWPTVLSCSFPPRCFSSLAQSFCPPEVILCSQSWIYEFIKLFFWNFTRQESSLDRRQRCLRTNLLFTNKKNNPTAEQVNSCLSQSLPSSYPILLRNQTDIQRQTIFTALLSDSS